MVGEADVGGIDKMGLASEVEFFRGGRSELVGGRLFRLLAFKGVESEV